MYTQIDTQLILEAVKQTGNIFLPGFKKNILPTEVTDFKIFLNDIEERCFFSLKRHIEKAYPAIPWKGDEFDYNEQKQPLDLNEYWLCDSMDGAVQYMQHLAGWTINLVLIRSGKPYFSVIYDPLSQEMFWAEAGKGAFLNGIRITPSVKTELKAMIAVFEYAFPYEKVPGLNKQIGLTVADMIEHFGCVRNYGPHGLQLAYVACGRIDVFVQHDLDTYNWLPGILIAQEAGAETINFNEEPWKWGDNSLIASPLSIGKKFIEARIANPL